MGFSLVMQWVPVEETKVVRKYLAIAAACAAFAGCSVTAPTNSTKQASNAQKNAVLAWAAACQTFDHAQQMLAVAITNGQAGSINLARVKTIQTAIVPLCTTFPANSAAAITQITISATELTQLLPTKAPTASTGGVK